MLKLNLHPFPLLETPRLKLRKLAETDVKEVFLLRSDMEVMKYIPRPLALSLQDALDHMEKLAQSLAANESINWAISRKGKDQLIGTIGLFNLQLENFRAEIGYMLLPAFQGMGLMDEALKAVVAYSFENLNFHSLEAVIDPLNTASERLLLQNNFVKEAHFKEKTFYKGVFLDDVVYSLLRTAK
jgi:ribosomal-protein-alanine N-acetyltransferase